MFLKTSEHRNARSVVYMLFGRFNMMLRTQAFKREKSKANICTCT